ncbi:hypothetical protein [Sphingomonas bacterium]|uniref:hypothetical protein n=1 Tax=Sphingomonas bacterium TaxID=1895847 RepID=UPI0020C6D34C|nr:hypothetical protein [Sphingomonas bacterium]
MQDFAYHRSVAPMMWVLVGLASIEFVVVHALLAMWKPAVAIVLSIATLASIVWLVAGIRSFRRLPVTLDAGMLVMRAGTLKRVAIPVSDIAGLRGQWDAAFVKRRATLNLALIAYPNIVVELAVPQRVGRRSIDAVAHRLDDRTAFVAAMERLGAADD